MPAKDSKITDPNYLACLAKAREKALLVRKQKAAERQEIQAAANFEHQQKLTAAREKLGTSKPATTEGTKSDPIQPTKPAKTEKTEIPVRELALPAKTKAKPKKKPEPEPEPESESEAETSETESESSVESEPPPPRHKKSSKPSRSAPEPQQKPSRSDSHRPSAEEMRYVQLHRSLFSFR